MSPDIPSHSYCTVVTSWLLLWCLFVTFVLLAKLLSQLHCTNQRLPMWRSVLDRVRESNVVENPDRSDTNCRKVTGEPKSQERPKIGMNGELLCKIYNICTRIECNSIAQSNARSLMVGCTLHPLITVHSRCFTVRHTMSATPAMVRPNQCYFPVPPYLNQCCYRS